MTEPCLQVAIDGPAASGKSTLGRSIAGALGWHFLDTGQMYRSVTKHALERGVAPDDAAELTRIAASLRFAFGPDALTIDGVPAGPELHSPEVDAAVSPVSAHPTVREVLVRAQRELAAGRCIVMVGRDIGTVVLPQAPVKLWLTASDEERTRRRLQDQPELQHSGQGGSARARLAARDRYDSTRVHSPLLQAPDAIVVETDARSPRQVLDQALTLIRAAAGDGPSC